MFAKSYESAESRKGIGLCFQFQWMPPFSSTLLWCCHNNTLFKNDSLLTSFLVQRMPLLYGTFNTLEEVSSLKVGSVMALYVPPSKGWALRKNMRKIGLCGYLFNILSFCGPWVQLRVWLLEGISRENILSFRVFGCCLSAAFHLLYWLSSWCPELSNSDMDNHIVGFHCVCAHEGVICWFEVDWIGYLLPWVEALPKNLRTERMGSLMTRFLQFWGLLYVFVYLSCNVAIIYLRDILNLNWNIWTQEMVILNSALKFWYCDQMYFSKRQCLWMGSRTGAFGSWTCPRQAYSNSHWNCPANRRRWNLLPEFSVWENQGREHAEGSQRGPEVQNHTDCCGGIPQPCSSRCNPTLPSETVTPLEWIEHLLILSF